MNVAVKNLGADAREEWELEFAGGGDGGGGIGERWEEV